MGYVMRLTEQNGYETPSRILKSAGLNYEQLSQSCSFLFKSSENFELLAQATSVSLSDLVSLTYPRADPSSSTPLFLFFGLPVPQYVLRPVRPKVCPSCLLETGYCRRIWDLLLVTTCPMHKRMLIDICPNCKQCITWIRNGVSICRCKFDWRESPSQPVEESELKVAGYVHRLCGLSTHLDDALLSSKRNPLFTLDLRNFISVMIFITGQYQGISSMTGKRFSGKGGKQNAELHALFMKAFSVFEDWPDQYYSFLDWRRTQKENALSFHLQVKSGLCKDFGRFYTNLYDRLSAGEFDFMRRAFSDYLANRWSGGYASNLNRRKGTTLNNNRKYVSKTEARRLLGVDHKWIDLLVKAGKLQAVVRNKGKKRLFLVDVTSVANLKREFDQLLNLEDVAKRLGVGRIITSDLVLNGCLKALRGPAIDGYTAWKFDRGDVDDLLNKIRNMMVQIPSSHTRNAITFRMASHKLGLQGIKSATFVKAIMNGDILPCGEVAGVGLSRFLFTRTALSNFVKEEITKERLTKLKF